MGSLLSKSGHLEESVGEPFWFGLPGNLTVLAEEAQPKDSQGTSVDKMETEAKGSDNRDGVGGEEITLVSQQTREAAKPQTPKDMILEGKEVETFPDAERDGKGRQEYSPPRSENRDDQQHSPRVLGEEEGLKQETASEERKTSTCPDTPKKSEGIEAPISNKKTKNKKKRRRISHDGRPVKRKAISADASPVASQGARRSSNNQAGGATENEKREVPQKVKRDESSAHEDTACPVYPSNDSGEKTGSDGTSGTPGKSSKDSPRAIQRMVGNEMLIDNAKCGEGERQMAASPGKATHEGESITVMVNGGEHKTDLNVVKEASDGDKESNWLLEKIKSALVAHKPSVASLESFIGDQQESLDLLDPLDSQEEEAGDDKGEQWVADKVGDGGGGGNGEELGTKAIEGGQDNKCHHDTEKSLYGPGKEFGDNPGKQSGYSPGLHCGDNPEIQAGDNPSKQSGDNPGKQFGDNPGRKSEDNKGIQAVGNTGIQSVSNTTKVSQNTGNPPGGKTGKGSSRSNGPPCDTREKPRDYSRHQAGVANPDHGITSPHSGPHSPENERKGDKRNASRGGRGENRKNNRKEAKEKGRRSGTEAGQTPVEVKKSVRPTESFDFLAGVKSSSVTAPNMKDYIKNMGDPGKGRDGMGTKKAVVSEVNVSRSHGNIFQDENEGKERKSTYEDLYSKKAEVMTGSQGKRSTPRIEAEESPRYRKGFQASDFVRKEILSPGKGEPKSGFDFLGTRIGMVGPPDGFKENHIEKIIKNSDENDYCDSDENDELQDLFDGSMLNEKDEMKKINSKYRAYGEGFGDVLSIDFSTGKLKIGQVEEVKEEQSDEIENPKEDDGYVDPMPVSPLTDYFKKEMSSKGSSGSNQIDYPVLGDGILNQLFQEPSYFATDTEKQTEKEQMFQTQRKKENRAEKENSSYWPTDDGGRRSKKEQGTRSSTGPVHEELPIDRFDYETKDKMRDREKAKQLRAAQKKVEVDAYPYSYHGHVGWGQDRLEDTTSNQHEVSKPSPFYEPDDVSLGKQFRGHYDVSHGATSSSRRPQAGQDESSHKSKNAYFPASSFQSYFDYRVSGGEEGDKRQETHKRKSKARPKSFYADDLPGMSGGYSFSSHAPDDDPSRPSFREFNNNYVDHQPNHYHQPSPRLDVGLHDHLYKPPQGRSVAVGHSHEVLPSFCDQKFPKPSMTRVGQRPDQGTMTSDKGKGDKKDVDAGKNKKGAGMATVSGRSDNRRRTKKLEEKLDY